MDDRPAPEDIPPSKKTPTTQPAAAVDEPEDDSGPDASEAPEEKGSASPPR